MMIDSSFIIGGCIIWGMVALICSPVVTFLVRCYIRARLREPGYSQSEMGIVMLQAAGLQILWILLPLLIAGAIGHAFDDTTQWFLGAWIAVTIAMTLATSGKTMGRAFYPQG